MAQEDYAGVGQIALFTPKSPEGDFNSQWLYLY
jgi:hypothetical protein